MAIVQVLPIDRASFGTFKTLRYGTDGVLRGGAVPWGELSSVPTTLAGYGITDAGTASDITTLGAGVVATDSYEGQDWGGRPTIIGGHASGSGVALGYKAVASNFEAVALGPQSRATGLATIAIGDAARALPSGVNGNEIVIGDTMWATGNCDYLIGGGCGTAFDFICGLGVQGQKWVYDGEIATADHQGYIGWYQEDGALFAGGAGFCNDWWIGGPVQAQAPHAITLNVTSGKGTNTAGVDFRINASRGTGNAAPGDIIFATATAGAGGTTLQTLTDRVRLDGVGYMDALAGTTLRAYPYYTTPNTPLSFQNAGNALFTTTAGVALIGYNVYYDTGLSAQRHVTTSAGWAITFSNNFFGEDTIHTVHGDAAGVFTFPHSFKSTGNLQAVSGAVHGWTNSATTARGALDTGLARNAPGVVEINNGTAGQWGGFKCGTYNAVIGIANGLTIGHNVSSGTPATNFGTGLLFTGQDATTPDQSMAQMAAVWTNAAHATPVSALTWSLVNGTAGTLAESVRLQGKLFQYIYTAGDVAGMEWNRAGSWFMRMRVDDAGTWNLFNTSSGSEVLCASVTKAGALVAAGQMNPQAGLLLGTTSGAVQSIIANKFPGSSVADTLHICSWDLTGSGQPSRMTLTSGASTGAGIASVRMENCVFQAPSFTTTQIGALTGMAAGSMVYDSVINKLKVYNGAAWEQVTSA